MQSQRHRCRHEDAEVDAATDTQTQVHTYKDAVTATQICRHRDTDSVGTNL